MLAVRKSSSCSIAVVEFGSAYTKIGYAQEKAPLAIIPSDFYDFSIKQDEKFNISQHFNKKKFVRFVRFVFNRHLLVTTGNRVILIFAIAYEKLIKLVAKILYEEYQVISVVVASSCCLCPISLGLESALVIDVGYTETRIIPIFENYPIITACRYLPVGSLKIHQKILKSLEIFNLNEEEAENIKAMTCFVTSYERSRVLKSGGHVTSPPDVTYKKGVVIPGILRETVCECLFDELSQAIIDAISNSPIDVRTSLAGNIVVVGGTAMLRGYCARLSSELAGEVERTGMNGLEFKFHSLPVPENCVSWFGGSVAGSVVGFIKKVEKMQDFEDFSSFVLVNKSNYIIPSLI